MTDASQPESREMPGLLREQQARASHEARTDSTIWERVWDHPWIGFALSATIPGLILALLGPFGSFGAPLWMRFAYWVPTMALGAAFGALTTRLIEWRLHGRPVAQFVAVTVVITVIMAGVAWGMGQLVFGAGSINFGATFVFYVFVISIVTAAITAIIRARLARIAIAAAPVTRVSEEPAVLAARLPAKLRGAQILALQGEDHYVRVHTDKGSDLILMRLSDAVGEMGDTPGARSHRSWWVAKAAVEGTRRENGRAWLQLSNAIEAPISRNYLVELRKAGWLD